MSASSRPKNVRKVCLTLEDAKGFLLDAMADTDLSDALALTTVTRICETPGGCYSMASSKSRRRPTCERCARLRKKCVWPDGTDKCERCENNGADCVARTRKKTGPAPGGAARKAARNRKRKREDETREVAATSDTRMSFWDAVADGWILASLSRLGPNHWGMQNMLYALTARAYAQGSAALLSRAYALVNSLGVGLRDVTGPLANGIRHTIHATFEAFPDVPTQYHDRALGLAPLPWTPESLGERLVGIATGVHSGSGHLGISPAFRTILGEELMSEIVVNSTPILFLAKALLQDRDVHRVVQALIYLVEQYTSKEVGPLCVKIQGVSSKSGVQYDEYITIWGEKIGHFYNIFELVPVSTSSAAVSSGGISAVSIDDVPDEELRAARSLTNLMGKK